MTTFAALLLALTTATAPPLDALYVGGRLKEAENAMQNALQLDPQNEEYPKRMAAIRAAAETIEMSR